MVYSSSSSFDAEPYAEVTVDDLRVLKRWDYDYLSYSADTPDEIAPFH